MSTSSSVASAVAQMASKRWFRSQTVWSGVASSALGLVAIAVAAGVPMPADVASILVALGAGQVASGAATIEGRVKANTIIRPTDPNQPEA